MNVFQALSDAGINPFGLQLVCESLLKGPIADQVHARGWPMDFFFPIDRSDCAGWAGVAVTLYPVKTGDPMDAEQPALPPLFRLAAAALKYDAAIQECANDPDMMSSHYTAEGEDLDTLYANWLSLARAAMATEDRP